MNPVFVPGHAVTIREVLDIVEAVVYYAEILAMTIVLAYIVYGGFTMATAGGDDGRFKKGKQTLINACIGLFVILALGLIVNTIGSFARNPGSIF